MKLKISDITSAISKVTELVSGEKTVPGILFSIGENELKVRYSDGRKSISQTIETESEEGDISGDIVVDYSRLVNILNKCQPSGIIVVDYIRMAFENNTIEIKAQQKCLVENEGEEVYRILAEKTMKINWVEVASSLRTSILGRMDYDSIFSASVTDEWPVDELVDVLSRTSTEKSRVIYMSPSIQKVFVANLAHTTSVEVSRLEVNELELEMMRQELEKSGELDKYEENKQKLYKRMKYAATLSTVVAKQICGILSKVPKDKKVYTHVNSGYFNIFTEDEKLGIWVAMSEGSKAQTSQFERFSAISYDSYQVNFVREFLADAIKSAVSSSSSEKIVFTFKENDNGEKVLAMSVYNSNASIDDEYNIITDDCVDMVGDILGKQLKVSLKVFSDMLAQLKSDVIGLDIKNMEDGSSCVRLSEIDMNKAIEEYYRVRGELNLSDMDPTPKEKKVEYRNGTLKTIQYTLVSK